jgi:hypothetical protein
LHLINLHQKADGDELKTYDVISSHFISKARFLCTFESFYSSSSLQHTLISNESKEGLFQHVKLIMSLSSQFLKNDITSDVMERVVAARESWVQLKIFGWKVMNNVFSYCKEDDILKHLLIWIRPALSDCERIPHHFMDGCCGASLHFRAELRFVWEKCFRNLLSFLNT